MFEPRPFLILVHAVRQLHDQRLMRFAALVLDVPHHPASLDRRGQAEVMIGQDDRDRGRGLRRGADVRGDEKERRTTQNAQNALNEFSLRVPRFLR